MSPAATVSESSVASSVEILWSRHDEWATRLAMVRDASQFLYLSVFYWEDDDYGQEMLAALQDAQRRGVRVQVIIDRFGQRLGGVLMTKAQRQRLKAGCDALRRLGGRVIFYQPGQWLQRILGGGHHVKVQVSEAGRLLLCSGNITKSSFEGWNECAVALRGPIVPVILDSCRSIGADVHTEDLDALRAMATQATSIPVDYWFCNPTLGRGSNALTDRMVEMVEAATRSLVITSFYFKPTPVLMDAVVRAARRGVAVEVFHSHRDALPATDLAWIAAAASYDRLLDAGVRIHERRRGEHSKIVLVDDNRVACGSYNFEDAAHDRLAEAMIATRDADVIAAVQRVVASLRTDPECVEVTHDTVRGWPNRVRARVRRLGRFKRWM